MLDSRQVFGVLQVRCLEVLLVFSRWKIFVSLLAGLSFFEGSQV